MRLDEIVRGIAITDRRGLFEEEIRTSRSTAAGLSWGACL